MPNLYVISGCNGSGKTTASFTVLPQMLDCDEFINADEIARGLSPLNPNRSAIEAGRLLIAKIDKLIEEKKDFAFETTLATRSYTRTIQKARSYGYQITLLFFWLDSVDLAFERVKTRVLEGGHEVPNTVIQRRYYSGITNLFKLYIPICDYWMLFNNSFTPSELIAEGYADNNPLIKNYTTFANIKQLSLHDPKAKSY
ncbi:MAG: zeta toxin [Bacteroidetes bacterium]|nr:zeta toxin [Bacteroidota bacterium]MBT3748977.1 zeta toxin [Bacteroidota bacterium]MBT4401825.1 zeta toxin [Bacteroidota bacterium]MBT4411115.1 zeta toxin [Bacteroidota bacterium]MBT5426043.1 zeta toxin [Bacteroidota bacterium]